MSSELLRYGHSAYSISFVRFKTQLNQGRITLGFSSQYLAAFKFSEPPSTKPHFPSLRYFKFHEKDTSRSNETYLHIHMWKTMETVILALHIYPDYNLSLHQPQAKTYHPSQSSLISRFYWEVSSQPRLYINQSPSSLIYPACWWVSEGTKVFNLFAFVCAINKVSRDEIYKENHYWPFKAKGHPRQYIKTSLARAPNPPAGYACDCCLHLAVAPAFPKEKTVFVASSYLSSTLSCFSCTKFMRTRQLLELGASNLVCGKNIIYPQVSVPILQIAEYQ